MTPPPGRRATWTGPSAACESGFADHVALECSQDKERRKLRPHVVMLRVSRAPVESATDTDSAVHHKVGELLEQTDWDQAGDLAVMHDHADELEELIPHRGGPRWSGGTNCVWD